MHLTRPRRGALALAGAAAIVFATPVGAVAAPGSPDDALPQALFGAADPQYDGVWRQSIALLAQNAAGYTPAPEAVEWLVGQQCADGSFQAYRAEPEETACADVTLSDSNATAVAVQTLAALGGHDEVVGDAVGWLAGVQNADGGWSYNPGGASDASSTAVVIGALVAAGTDPAEVTRDGSDPYDALTGLQLGCTAPAAERGGFAWQPDPDSGELFVNDAATADVVLALQGAGLLVTPDAAGPDATDGANPDDDAERDQQEEQGQDEEGEEEPQTPPGALECDGDQPVGDVTPQSTGAAGAAYLTARLEAGEQHLVSAFPGAEEQPDFGSTARAVIALAAAGEQESAEAVLGWLRDHHGDWPDYAANPAAVGTLVLAAHAVGAAPEGFGGTDLISELSLLGPAPEGVGPATESASSSDENGSGSLVWVILIGLVVGIGIGVFLSVRRKARPRDGEAGSGSGSGSDNGSGSGSGKADE
ncbi:prenyltransferase/squalene oxidase repeat-containing protein [Streptomyces carpaticus]|uniref:Prenyltransferase/squalene oxidase repeat-containing protein n=1 Tax=Streptomyces carpaticus TaxID=285558 RepID=A0ABV4ZJF5_9ACTN